LANTLPQQDDSTRAFWNITRKSTLTAEVTSPRQTELVVYSGYKDYKESMHQPNNATHIARSNTSYISYDFQRIPDYDRIWKATNLAAQAYTGPRQLLLL